MCLLKVTIGVVFTFGDIVWNSLFTEELIDYNRRGYSVNVPIEFYHYWYYF